MASIYRVKRATGYAWRADVRPDEPGLKPFSKVFKTKLAAQTWAKRIEADADLQRAHGNQAAQSMTLADLIREFTNSKELDNGVIINLGWWAELLSKVVFRRLNQAAA